jgi:hypothetical protein
MPCGFSRLSWSTKMPLKPDPEIPSPPPSEPHSRSQPNRIGDSLTPDFGRIGDSRPDSPDSRPDPPAAES